MKQQDAETIYYSKNTPESCQREIDDREAHCDLACSFLGPACSDCEVPLIISILNKRKNELTKQGE